mmetsp:Transcript_70163/g.203491  ORF Transcript_70163/g.203491 Transcript_70163/m.203491 type:complete len:382 (-) Transcript_70163:26-1171(-)
MESASAFIPSSLKRFRARFNRCSGAARATAADSAMTARSQRWLPSRFKCAKWLPAPTKILQRALPSSRALVERSRRSSATGPWAAKASARRRTPASCKLLHARFSTRSGACPARRPSASARAKPHFVAAERQLPPASRDAADSCGTSKCRMRGPGARSSFVKASSGIVLRPRSKPRSKSQHSDSAWQPLPPQPTPDTKSASGDWCSLTTATTASTPGSPRGLSDSTSVSPPSTSIPPTAGGGWSCFGRKPLASSAAPSAQIRLLATLRWRMPRPGRPHSADRASASCSQQELVSMLPERSMRTKAVKSPVAGRRSKNATTGRKASSSTPSSVSDNPSTDALSPVLHVAIHSATSSSVAGPSVSRGGAKRVPDATRRICGSM